MFRKRIVVVGVVALIMVGALVIGGLQALRARTQPTGNCQLPLATMISREPSPYLAEFVVPATGRVSPADPAKDIAGLPPAGGSPRISYDPAFHRWLPVPFDNQAPDHRAYTYVVGRSTPSDYGLRYSYALHVYDLTSGTDRTILAQPESADSVVWRARGIEVVTGVEFMGATLHSSLVRPADGSVQETHSFMFTTSLPVELGHDQNGRAVVREGGFDKGSAYVYYVQGKDGAKVVIYSGRHGDSTGFEPGLFVSDGNRLWTSNTDGTTVWSWSDNEGLQRFKIGKQDTVLDRHTYYVAGPCS